MKSAQQDNKLTSLFLQSSIDDNKKAYNNSLRYKNASCWDIIVLTASNKKQALGFEKQIEYRKSKNLLPIKTDIVVVPDEKDLRVGSGGSTLSVISKLKDKYNSIENKRILVIHAGGNSARCPQYSAIGKIFAPLPTVINGMSATIFDMILITMASMPSRMKNGMMLLSGDVTLLFNSLMCDFGNSDAAVISFKEDASVAKNHGVYIANDNTGNVKSFLHKQPIETLKKMGAVDERNMCSIDTGAMWLSPNVINALYSLVDTKEKYESIINEKSRLSLYSDIAFSLAEDSTLDKLQNEVPEGSLCDELTFAREKLWNAIGKYNMKLIKVSPSKFIHFGTIPEIMQMMTKRVSDYEYLGWSMQNNSAISEGNNASYNSIVGAKARIGKDCYLETSYIHNGATVGNKSYISCLDIKSNTIIPNNVIMHGQKLNNGKFICFIMGINDNPKADLLFGVKFSEIEKKTGLSFEDTLWESKLYPECDTIDEAIKYAINLCNIILNNDNATKYFDSSKISMSESFADADIDAIIEWNNKMDDLIAMNKLSKAIKNNVPVNKVLVNNPLSAIQSKWIKDRIAKLDFSNLEDFSYAIRLYYYLGVLLNDNNYIKKSFDIVSNTVQSSVIEYDSNIKIKKDSVQVNLPLRVNFGGGWSDTCPYCLENGGTVLNAAIKLDGILPVQVRINKINELKIAFESSDMDVYCEYTDISELQNTGNPYDAFALQKACLIACGIIPKTGGNLQDVLSKLGGGFVIKSEVVNVPKGSGLGTSSILSAATVKAVFEFVGISYTNEKIYSTVLAMEQIMSTCGGWQDQVGGLINGIKLITSNSGLNQQLKIEQINISDKTKEELSNRFAIIYSGQRRLARNILYDVVGKYLSNDNDSICAHKEIKNIAIQMKKALINDDINAFAVLMNEHWEQSKRIDADSTNTLIDQIFISIEDLIDGKMICGAGGGGFLQVILKQGVTKQDLHDRLNSVFNDFSVDVWNSEFI